MKNKYFTYINNSSSEALISIDYVDEKGNRQVINIKLKPKATITDSIARAMVGVGTKGEILDASVHDTAGVKRSIMHSDPLGSAEAIMKKSVVLDIETTGRLGPQSITQIGIYEPASKKGTAIFPSVNALSVPEVSAEAAYKSRLSVLKSLPSGIDFRSLQLAEAFARKQGTDLDYSLRLIQNPAQKEIAEKYMFETDKFQAYQVLEEKRLRELAGTSIIDPNTGEMYKELQAKRMMFEALNKGGVDETTLRQHFELGTGNARVYDRLFRGGMEIRSGNMRDILTKDMPELLKDKVVWIANAPFESTQFGAHIDAFSKESFEALNTARKAAGGEEISEKTFVRYFGQGRYEEELEAINSSRPADNQLVTKNPMYGVTQGVSTSSGKPFYVTGREFQEARRLAQKTGDWSKLYKAFIDTTQVGDVRDILDLPRMQQSMLIKSGLMTSSEVPTSLGVEVQARLFGVTEQLRKGKPVDVSLQRIFQKELHTGISDVALSETPILREALDQLQALHIVSNNLDGAQELRKQAARGEGALFRAQMYGRMMDYLNTPVRDGGGSIIESLHDVQIKARAGRYALDIAEQGSFEIRETQPGYNVIRQAKEVAPGVTEEYLAKINKTSRTHKTTFFDILDEIGKLPEYKNARVGEIQEEIKTHFRGTYNVDTGDITDKDLFTTKAMQLSESADSQIRSIEQHFAGSRIVESSRDSIVKDTVLETGRSTQADPTKVVVPEAAKVRTEIVANFEDYVKRTAKAAKPKTSSIIPKIAGRIGAVGLGFAAISAVSPPTIKESKSLLMPTEEKFIQAKAKQNNMSEEDFVNALKTRFNNIEGLQEKGVSQLMRKAFTDFGSPYQGMGYSSSVLQDYNLRRERQRYISSQFMDRHFSVDGDVGFQLRRFVDSAFKAQIGTKVNAILAAPATGKLDESRYPKLAGRNLNEYNLSKNNDYKISMEDADTLTVNSSRGKFSFRLAGIDSPEISHNGRAAQPYSEEAKAFAAEMIANAKDVRMVVEEGDMTYGRQVGVLYADGKNINLELIKRGFAAYLPYKGKGKEPIYDRKAFEEAENRAFEANRGMWSTNFFRAYKEIKNKSGQSVTFNTLANDSKVAQNMSMMSMKAIMDTAQKENFISQATMQDIEATASLIKMQDKPFSPDSGKGFPSIIDMQTYGKNPNTILSVLDQQKYEVGSLMRTRNSSSQSEKYKTKRINKNNLELTSSTMAKEAYSQENEARNIENKRSKQLAYLRVKKMEELQQNALRNQFNSPIGHHRM